MAKCNLDKVNHNPTMSTAAFPFSMYNQQWYKRLASNPCSDWADLCRSFYCTLVNLWGFWLPGLPTLSLQGLGNYGARRVHFYRIPFSLKVTGSSCMQGWFLLTELLWISSCQGPGPKLIYWWCIQSILNRTTLSPYITINMIQFQKYVITNDNKIVAT